MAKEPHTITQRAGVPTVHEAYLDLAHRQVITVLLNRLGGKATITLQELEATNQWLLGWHLDVPKRPTGDTKLDVAIAGVLTFETRKRQ
jgi:hypothetical protein